MHNHIYFPNNTNNIRHEISEYGLCHRSSGKILVSHTTALGSCPHASHDICGRQSCTEAGLSLTPQCYAPMSQQLSFYHFPFSPITTP